MAGLHLYASEKILLGPSVTSRKDSRPLLHYALSQHGEFNIVESIIETLLRYSTNPNEIYSPPDGFSAWELYWWHLYEDAWCLFDENECPFEGFVKPMQAMILHGAYVNA